MIKKFIDVEKLIGSKNPKLLKRLPAFIIRYLKRILHQDEVNLILDENKDLIGAEFCHELIDRFELDVKLHDVSNVPKEGGVILVCNHPLGGMDAMALVDKFVHYRNDMKFIVNDILLNLENLRGLFVGVNKHGSTAISTLQNVDALFNSDKAVFVFPAGLVSRKIDGKIQDLEWKKTFVTRAKKYQQPIVPVHIEGRLSNFFYRLHRIREMLGIKANIEMLYLVNELFKQKKRRIDIRFGKAIFPTELDSAKNDKQWASEIRKRCYALAK